MSFVRHVYVFVSICMYECMYVRTYVCLHIYKHTRMQVYSQSVLNGIDKLERVPRLRISSKVKEAVKKQHKKVQR